MESNDQLLPFAGHIVFTTVAGQGWLAGPSTLSGCFPKAIAFADGVNERPPIGRADIVAGGRPDTTRHVRTGLANPVRLHHRVPKPSLSDFGVHGTGRKPHLP